MIRARQLLARSLLVVVVSVPAVQGMAAPKVAAHCGTIQILSEQLSAREAEAYCLYAVSERQKVEDFPGHYGNRGFVEMPLRVVRSNDGALLHEIVHIYAPNDNRFLAEGLAVYVHQKLADNRAFPNFGKPLDTEARERLAQIESLDRLNGVRTPSPLGTVLSEQSAYILAGSFVGFLIEQHGLTEFRKLYETGAYEAVYGKSLEVL